MNPLKITEVSENFPFRAILDRQRKVIEDTCNALNSGCKHIIRGPPLELEFKLRHMINFISLRKIYQTRMPEDLLLLIQRWKEKLL
jgi:hypothetical protein